MATKNVLAFHFEGGNGCEIIAHFDGNIFEEAFRSRINYSLCGAGKEL